MFKLAGSITKIKGQKFNVLKKTVIIVAAVVALIAIVSVSVGNFNKAAAYKHSAEEASVQCSEVQEDIEKKENLINGEGFDEYCEKIAREKYGYAKPGEYVIYDSSYGN